MNGQLQDQPLAELIHEISNAGLSGALRLTRERVKAAVYFDGGRVVAALTNLRAYRLVEVLRRAGLVAAEKLEGVVAEAMSDEQACAALSGAGLLGGAELNRLRGRQSEEVLRALLRWPDGEWSFDARVRFAADFRADLNTPQLLIEAARESAPELIARSVPAADEKLSMAEVSEVDATQNGGPRAQLMPAEAFVLSRVAAPLTYGELAAVSGLPEAETERAVYALALGGLLRRERPPRFISPDALKQARARHTPHAATEPAAREAAPEPEPTPPAPAEPVEVHPREAMEELFARARAATHYETLGVTRSAQTDEIKRAYYALAKRLHPDRFRRDSDEPLRQQIDFSFAKIARAYDVLKDASQRAAYDLTLAAPRDDAPSRAAEEVERPAPEQPSPAPSKESATLYRAEDKFQQGLAALQQKNLGLARRYLGEAALLSPKQARYRAFYGRALAGDKASRRQAEAELQAAIALDEKNASYRVMLAELYRDIGLRRRAESELGRALALDPEHASALTLLAELRDHG